MTPLIPKDVVARVLRNTIPDAEWLLSQIESQEGWFRFPSYLIEAIANLRLESYPLLYTNEVALHSMVLRGVLNEAEIKGFLTEFEASTLDERGKFIAELVETLGPAFDAVELPKTPQEREAAKELFDKLSPDEQQESLRLAQRYLCMFLPIFYQSLSTMVHGEKLTSLVSQAQVGNDQAFVKAVQIDRRILTAIPFFEQRYARAQDEADKDFFDLLSYRQKCAPYRGKIRHKTLWLTFSILDQVGLLDTLSHREILEICDEAGVGGYDNRIQSEKHLGTRLREYREFQKRGVVTTT